MPSLVATMLAVPAATAVTVPVELTVAAAALELDQLIVRPERTFPLASFRTAVACVEAPTPMLPEATLTVTEATGTGGGGGVEVTVRLTPPLFPSLVALIVADPAATAVT